ncbi:MAG: hypothetical protein HYT77_10180 [Deltaproteobacteria bacterium]|nr:hypothetical protein [Deltaproteobacteria bacterium]
MSSLVNSISQVLKTGWEFEYNPINPDNWVTNTPQALIGAFALLGLAGGGLFLSRVRRLFFSQRTPALPTPPPDPLPHLYFPCPEPIRLSGPQPLRLTSTEDLQAMGNQTYLYVLVDTKNNNDPIIIRFLPRGQSNGHEAMVLGHEAVMVAGYMQYSSATNTLSFDVASMSFFSPGCDLWAATHTAFQIIFGESIKYSYLMR